MNLSQLPLGYTSKQAYLVPSLLMTKYTIYIAWVGTGQEERIKDILSSSRLKCIGKMLVHLLLELGSKLFALEIFLAITIFCASCTVVI